MAAFSPTNVKGTGRGATAIQDVALLDQLTSARQENDELRSRINALERNLADTAAAQGR